MPVDASMPTQPGAAAESQSTVVPPGSAQLPPIWRQVSVASIAPAGSSEVTKKSAFGDYLSTPLTW